MKRILLAWSSGKDSAWALHRLRHGGEWEVAGLLTTFNEAFGRVAMHAVRRQLVEQQAAAAGLPLWPVEIPWPCPNEEYERRMAAACGRAVAQGIGGVAFGDLFLEDVRAYRERQLAPTGLEPLFPLWRIPTDQLAREMIAGGQRSVITCVDPGKLDREFAGREIDLQFLRELPRGVDPCGENGEFHSFVYAGPEFARPLDIVVGETVERDGFLFVDVLPAPVAAGAGTQTTIAEP
jgi:uncharacterized protein (TIGR00290 family)